MTVFSGLFVTVPIWLEGLYLFLTKSDHDLSPLCESRGKFKAELELDLI